MDWLEQHEIGKRLSPLLSEESRVLRDSIRRDGLLDPIWLYQGQVLDGWHRYLICIDGDVEPRFREYIGDDPLTFVLGLHVGRRNLTAEARQELAAELRAQGMSYRQIGETLGVSHEQARHDVSSHLTPERSEAGGEFSPPERVSGRDGKTYPAARPVPIPEPVAPPPDEPDKSTPEAEADDPAVSEVVAPVESPADINTKLRMETEVDARRGWLQELVKLVRWTEYHIGMLPSNEHIAWNFRPGSPGSFDHGITADRLGEAIGWLQRVHAVLKEQQHGKP